MLHNFDFNIAVISILIILLARSYSYKEEKRFRKTNRFSKSLFLVHFKPSSTTEEIVLSYIHIKDLYYRDDPDCV